MGKKGDLSDFECGIVVGAKRAGRELLIYWYFHPQPSLRFTEKTENIKTSFKG